MTKIFRAALAAFLVCAFFSAASAESYFVKKGDNISTIAKTHKVSWWAMLLENEEYLQDIYDDTCGKLSKTFRNRAGKQPAAKGGSYFCNDSKLRAYGNTLKPGWELSIPDTSAPTSISETVRAIVGKKITLVIDDTGSMSNKRTQVAQFYLAALQKSSKEIAGVFLFADGKVRKYEAGGVRDLESILVNQGDYENTLQALKEAAKEKPDAIVLVTDEEGNDWGDWSGVKGLPPVIAHCLPTSSNLVGCDKTLPRLAAETKGRYIWGLEESASR